ncbi:MAG: NUDIX domain-containing protein [Ruminococcaceae bacterium]|nr:NUDIX domain-containing protein [Oscillospiraceae bacterium]
MIREKSCGALVLRNAKSADGNKKTYLLMIRHSNGGHRSFPKGHVEHGETEKMTAEREVREETSVRIHISEKFREAVYYKPRPNSNKEVIYFLAFTKQAQIFPREGEIAEVEWVPIDEARDALTHDNDKRVFDAAIEYLKERKLGGF